MYTVDEIFNVQYNENKDKLEIKNKKVTSKKFLKILITLFGVFSIMNTMLIFTFVKLLKNI